MTTTRALGPLGLPLWCWAAPIAAFACAGLKLAHVGLPPLLLALSLFVAVLSLSTGRTTTLNAIIQLVLFATYLFFVILP